MLGSAELTARTGIELDVTAAVIIGGTSLKGRKGTIEGGLICATIMGVSEERLRAPRAPLRSTNHKYRPRDHSCGCNRQYQDRSGSAIGILLSLTMRGYGFHIFVNNIL